MHSGQRQVDRLSALDQIIDECEGMEDLGAWLIPGDLFHARSSIADRNALKERVKRMANAAPVVICRGNHDADGDLDIFGDLGATHAVDVYSKPHVVSMPIGRSLAAGRQRATVFVLPWPTEAGLVSAGVPPDRIAQEAREALDVIFSDAGLSLTKARQRGELTLMIGHVNVAGAKLSSVGQPAIGTQIEVDQSQLDRLGHCYKAMNHVHIAQEACGAYYAGSICRLSWGETEQKSYNVVTYEWINNGASTDYPSWWEYNVETRPLNVAPMYHVEGWLTRDGFEKVVATAGPDGTVVQKPSVLCASCSGTGTQPLGETTTLPCDQCLGSGAIQSWVGCEVRVRARYRQSEGSVLELAQAHVKREFAGALRFEFEPICVPDRALRAPEVAVARTFQEKLEAWATVAGVALTDDVTTKAALLEQPDADAVASDVERHMAELSGAPVEDHLASQGSIFARMS